MSDRATKGPSLSLPVANPGPPGDRIPPGSGVWPVVRSILLRLYRVGVIVAIVWLIRHHHDRERIESGIRVDEVRPFLPAAHDFRLDTSEKQRLIIINRDRNEIGYALRTSPVGDFIRGYSGPTDTLVVMDARGRIVGLRIRSSADTKEHVRSVAQDEYFMKFWNDKTWEEMAGSDPKSLGVEGVSGASLTSMAMANALHHRFKKGMPNSADIAGPPIRFGWHDAALVAVIATALLFSFTHLRSKVWARRAFQVVLIGYVGFWNGQLLAQSLAAGWAVNGIAWRMAPALALLAAAALAVPWVSRRAVYCSQICPHGAAQELLGRVKKKKWKVPPALDAALRWIPPALILLVVAVAMWQFPGQARSAVREPVFELAGIEPFDAYLVFIGKVGLGTVVVAIAGLIISIFVPMAYCKYGCPTGLVLNFVRSHGRADHFGRRDIGAALLLALSIGLYSAFGLVAEWVNAGKPPLW